MRKVRKINVRGDRLGKKHTVEFLFKLLDREKVKSEVKSEARRLEANLEVKSEVKGEVR